MFKLFLLFFFLISSQSYALSLCDVEVAEVEQVKVLKFKTRKPKVSELSKFLLKEASPLAIQEEMINLQDMGLCYEKFIPRSCSLKVKNKKVTLLRDGIEWTSWSRKRSADAKVYFNDLKKLGICFKSSKKSENT